MEIPTANMTPITVVIATHVDRQPKGSTIQRPSIGMGCHSSRNLAPVRPLRAYTNDDTVLNSQYCVTILPCDIEFRSVSYGQQYVIHLNRNVSRFFGANVRMSNSW
jgi:hypothetical protein